MKSVVDVLNERIGEAMARVTERQDCAAIVRPATDPRFGDYQANGVMALAKQITTNPRKLAESVVQQLDVSDLCEPPEVAGPGFINLRLKPAYVAAELLRIAGDKARLGNEKASEPQTVVVDFSSPNIAKEMHVGHLRSTIIGDAVCRLLEFLGHKVIRQNHIGDWGVQMAMVVRAIKTECENITNNNSNPDLVDLLVHDPQAWEIEALKRLNLSLPQLESLYVKSNQALATGHPTFEKNMRAFLFGLHHGQPGCLNSWLKAREITLQACQQIYDQLGVQLSMEDVRGESFYKDMLQSVVEDLQKIRDPEGKSIATKSEGAVCVFPPGFKTKEGEALPFIIQKSDGAYLYATTDLAALRYRVNELKADKIVYVTDARQIQHFQMLFQVAEMAGWDRRDGKKVELIHVTFGSVMGEDGRPLKTRSGENVKLKDLLDEAVERARAVVEEKNPDLPSEQKAEIAKAVGIGAVKYADYSNNRTSDYVFSFDKMLAMDGNTAPYMQYAYARIKSIERKAQSRDIPVQEELTGIRSIRLDDPAELDLAKHLARYAEAVESAAAEYRPNFLTSYLYELAQKFSAFYTNCPVLDAPTDKRPTRLLLCDLTADTIRHGLSELLGIAVVGQM